MDFILFSFVFLFLFKSSYNESFSGKDSSFLITPILGMAKVLGTIGRTAKAVEFYHRAVSILESNRGFEDEDLVIPLFSLGNLLLKEGKGKDAEACFARYSDSLFLSLSLLWTIHLLL